MSRVASIPIAKADCHAATAGVTYLRRTSIAAVCNLMQEDDDGNAAADPKKRGKGAHSPIQDSLKELSTSELAKANSVSILMTKAHRDGNVEEARRLFYDNGLINEVKSGIWELLQSNSKCRSAVSALQTTRRI
jgi:hypothetical protein